MARTDTVIAPPWVLTLLSSPERQLLGAEGLLTQVAPNAWLETDLAGSAHHRAACLASAVPATATAIDETAAWVYLGGELRWPLLLAVPHGQRTPMRPGVHHGRCMPVPSRDCRVMNGLRLLDPAGAAAELARRSPEPRILTMIRGLIATHDLTAEHVAARVRAYPRRPATRRALALLRSLDVPVLATASEPPAKTCEPLRRPVTPILAASSR